MLADAIRLSLLLLFPALMAFAACSDLLTMTISNRLSLALVAGFFALAFAVGMSPMAIMTHVGAAALVLVFAFVFFARGWIGGGDAKLAAAIMLWLGFDHLVVYLLYASLAGGLLTLLLLQVRAIPLPGMLMGQQWAERLHQKGGGVPYGIALAAAALIVYPDTIWMRAVVG
jgi:prepilin peptidase CpaA